jgi:hypothetical protein
MNRLTAKKRCQVVAALVEGNSLRSTCRMTGVAFGVFLSMLTWPQSRHRHRRRPPGRAGMMAL